MRIAVVGAGMIGTAAARHLAELGHKVALIGPPEPENKGQHRGVFASHYDEGRITRQLDARPFWATVSQRSIARYRALEKASGIAFFMECGSLIAGPSDGEFLRMIDVQRQSDNVPCRRLVGPDLDGAFPYFSVPDGSAAFFEPKDAGFVNPRALVRAQLRSAANAGAEHVVATANGIHEAPSAIRIDTSEGTVEADHVIVAAGAYASDLLGDRLELTVHARTIFFLRVEGEELERLSKMPTIILDYCDGTDIYALPPIRYPDGAHYIKIGGDPTDRPLSGSDDIGAWFRSGGDPMIAALLEEKLRGLMPGIQGAGSHHSACVTTYTAENMPAIRRMSDRVTVAAAGCGRGAKCSDELGRLAALCATGVREDPLLSALAA
ncbi:MAG: FAD-dependent oxidoreductase [Pseudomonadota bacterium]